MQPEDIFYLIAGLIILIAGGEVLVRGASAIAYRLQISRMVVGLTIVAFGTSSPELFISVQSALKGSADMAMGNVVGSNICNLGLVLGITALIAKIPVDESSLKIDWPMAMGSAVLLYILVHFGALNWVEGVAFVLVLITYLTYVIRKSRKDNKAKDLLAAEAGIDVTREKASTLEWIKSFVFIAIGCTGLYYGSEWFVGSAENIFSKFIEPRVVGLMVLALGTSLPELATSVIAAYKKNTDLALGNLIGSNIFNVLSILGITSIVKPIAVSPEMMADMLWMLGITFIIFPFMWYKRKLTAIHGVLLLAVYGIYVYSIL
jgi:cation:H+ antiporter